jgi:hypothetical protein
VIEAGLIFVATAGSNIYITCTGAGARNRVSIRPDGLFQEIFRVAAAEEML